MKRVLSLALAAVMACMLAVPALAQETGELEGSIVILHTNDVHGAIEGYAKVAALKDDYEAKGAYVLLLDAGDFIQGDPAVSASQGASAVELMNLTDHPAYQERKKALCAKMWEIIKDTQDDTLMDAEYYLMRFAPVGPGEKKRSSSYSVYNKSF